MAKQAAGELHDDMDIVHDTKTHENSRKHTKTHEDTRKHTKNDIETINDKAIGITPNLGNRLGQKALYVREMAGNSPALQ